MKRSITLVCVFAASACSNGSSSGPTALAEGAAGGMWSSKPVAEVAACLDRITPVTGVNGEPLRFHATLADPRRTRYVTLVSIFGDVASYPDQAKAAAGCL